MILPTHGFAFALLGWITVAAPGQASPLSLEQFFAGHLSAEGKLENYREQTKRPFTIDMQAHWSGGKGTLIEEVAFADGERQHKVWTFDKMGDDTSSVIAAISPARPT